MAALERQRRDGAQDNVAETDSELEVVGRVADMDHEVVGRWVDEVLEVMKTMEEVADGDAQPGAVQPLGNPG